MLFDLFQKKENKTSHIVNNAKNKRVVLSSPSSFINLTGNNRIRFRLPNYHVYSQFERMSNSIHLLIAGTTGCGKSNLLDGIICELIQREPLTSDGIKLVLIDPKMVELSKYKELPHTVAYADNNEDILSVLNWVISEMEGRYKAMQSQGTVKYTGDDMYVIVDELGDLMTTCRKEVMPKLQRIAQLGRACKIHLFCATQSPSRKVIPAELQINFTNKVAMCCASNRESRQIMDIPRIHAEELPIHGKVYFQDNIKVYEVNVPLVDRGYINRLINHWKENYKEL